MQIGNKAPERYIVGRATSADPFLNIRADDNGKPNPIRRGPGTYMLVEQAFTSHNRKFRPVTLTVSFFHESQQLEYR